jgi:PTS system mannose-specific IIC component
LFVGIVLGDVRGAMVVSAAIQLIYMGVIAPGGQMPAEPAVASAVAVAAALVGNLQPTAAVAIAVPVGMLGSYLYAFKIFLNSFVLKVTEGFVERLEDKKFWFSIYFLPLVIAMVLFVPTLFIALYFGTPIISSITSSAQGTIIFHVLDVVGGGLAALGIALTLHVIGKRNYLWFFFLAFFIAEIFQKNGITMVTFAILGTIVAGIFVLTKNMAKKGAE